MEIQNKNIFYQESSAITHILQNFRIDEMSTGKKSKQNQPFTVSLEETKKPFLIFIPASPL